MMLVKHNQDSSGMEDHPWNHFIPSDATTLIIGTFPNGNALDFLINRPGQEMVVDAKYKMKYLNSEIHADIR